MSHAELIDVYLAGAESVRHAVRGLSGAQMRARPVAGKWTILEVLCHLADSETMFAERMKRVLAEDRPSLPFADPDRYVATLAYQARDADEELLVIRAVRGQMSRILRAQPATAWERIGLHSKEGERTLEQLVSKAIDHMDHHLQFVRTKRETLESDVKLDG